MNIDNRTFGLAGDLVFAGDAANLPETGVIPLFGAFAPTENSLLHFGRLYDKLTLITENTFLSDILTGVRRGLMIKRKILIYMLVLALSVVLAFFSPMLLTENQDSVFLAALVVGSYFLFFGCIIYPIVKAVKAIHNKIVSGKVVPREMSYSRVTRPEDVRKSETVVYNKKETFRFDKSAEGYGWGLLTFFFIVFFPVGFFMAVTKIVNEKSNYRSNGTMMAAIGAVFLVPSLAAFAFFAVSEYKQYGTFADSAVILAPFCVAVLISLVILILGCFFARKGGIFDKYMYLITVKRITNIDKIATQLQTSHGKAVRVIKKLINEGLLKNAFIYYTDNEVLVPGISEKTALKCANCGGTTILYSNEERVCGYCGGKI